MARAEGDNPTGVTEASATSGEAAPMVEAPANPTEAQQASQGLVDRPSPEAVQQAKEDAKWREENPNKVRTREANPAVGGESFAYLDTVDEGVHPDQAPANPDNQPVVQG